MINDIICGNQNTPYLEYKDYLKYRDLCAVACQGGGAKGSWQAGVLYGLNQNNINIKTFFGTSVGALNAALCHTNQYDLLKELWHDKPPLNIFKNKYIIPPRLKYNKLYEIIDKYINNQLIIKGIENGNSLYIRVSNLNNGLSELKMYDSKNNDNNILQTLKASSALFPYFPSIKINNFDYIDGGIHANCPTQFLNNIGQVDSIIISSTRAFNESIKLNCSTKIKRVIDMLLFSQLINDLKLIQKDISKYNSDLMTHIGPINPDLFKTVYFINPSGPLKNDTTQISEKNSKHDFSLGVTDAKNFIDNSMKYDIESMVFQ